MTLASYQYHSFFVNKNEEKAIKNIKNPVRRGLYNICGHFGGYRSNFDDKVSEESW